MYIKISIERIKHYLFHVSTNTCYLSCTICWNELNEDLDKQNPRCSVCGSKRHKSEEHED